MDIRAYLKRIGWTGHAPADFATLARLQTGHLYSVPFENLSIHFGENIRLDYSWLFDKIVTRRRGGFCYELNGLFGQLLQALGFRVSVLSARVRSSDGGFGPEFDHLVLKVDLDKSWLVDVGFGRAFNQPLALDTDEEQVQGTDRFKITYDQGDLIYWRFEDAWLPEYRFTTQERALHDFNGMCRYHQTSPQSSFTRRWMATMLSAQGRETLHQDGQDFRYIITDASGRHERIIQGMDNAMILLEEVFGIHEDSLVPAGKRRRSR